MGNVPELLTTLSGIKVTDKDAWEIFRRDEVKSLCERFEYGIRDIEKPDDLYFSIEKTYEIYGMMSKEITGGSGNFQG